MTWPTDRLSRLADVWPSNVDKHSIEGQPAVRLCNYTDVYKNPSINGSMSFMPATAAPEQIERFRLLVGDTLITKDSETADDIGIPAFVEYEAPDLICGYHLAIVRPHLSVAEPRFVYWALSSEFVLRQWSVLASGVTRVALRSADLSRVRVPCPSLGAQRAIVDYLDRETAQIDTLISKQEQLIATLRERRTALAEEELATRVGVGERLRWSVVENDSRAGAAGAKLPLLSVSIAWGVRRRETMFANESRADDFSTYKRALPGDIVVNRMRAFQGALGVAQEAGIVSPDYAVLQTAAQLSPDWLAALMRTPRFIAEMTARLKGIGNAESGTVRTPRINVADLLGIPIELPSLEAQSTQLQRLRARERDIDALIAKAERFIEIAKERRAALITAAVTGQIDVQAE